MAISWHTKSAHVAFDVEMICRRSHPQGESLSSAGIVLDTSRQPVKIVCEAKDLEALQRKIASALNFVKDLDVMHILCDMSETPDTWWPHILVTVAQSLYTVPNQAKEFKVYVSPGERSWEYAKRLADSVIWVKDLVNMPPNLKPPQALATLFQNRAREKNLPINWHRLELEDLIQMQAGGMLAVGQGSANPPVLLAGRYEGKPGSPWLGLIGKGITFDSGGISLKPAENMGRLKADMTGSAVMMAALELAAEMHWPINILAVAPLAENLPDGAAYRPGDVITMMDKTTVEIASTDAEGRLILADALTYALESQVSHVIDMATLTGTNVIALGGVRAGLVFNDERWAECIFQAGESSLEKVWKLPHDKAYQDMNKSLVADLKNSGGRAGGTISAGLFIGHFAKGVPWAHIDIAGMAINDKNGATGFGMLLMAEIMQCWIRDYA